MITPLRNLVLVSLADEPPVEGLIQVVGRERQPSTHAVVLAVGAEVRDVRVVARVVISRLQGIAIGDDKLLLAEGAVLAQERAALMPIMLPARGLLSVRPVETAESLPGGSVILTAATRERLAANQVEVVAVGAFAVCDDEDCERPHAVVDGAQVHTHPVAAGAWVLVAPRSTIAGPNPDRTEWFVHQDNVLGIFNVEATQ